MAHTDTPDHQRASTTELLEGLSASEPLALAEAYHRTGVAAHSVGRRLLGSPREVEALLVDVYSDLWREPPSVGALEAWVRQRTFARARQTLREQGRKAASASAALLLRDNDVPVGSDRTEQAIAALDDAAVRALLLAHDRGTPTSSQREDGAAADLRRALLALAEAEDRPGCDDPRLADDVLGLTNDEESAELARLVASDRACADLTKDLRRGRRKIEGLPPAPDLGQRVLVAVLTSGGAVAEVAPPLEAPDAPEGAAAAAAGAGASQPPVSPAPEAGAPPPATEPVTAETADDDAPPADTPEATEEARADVEPASALDDLIGDLPTAREDLVAATQEGDTDEITVSPGRPSDEVETGAFATVYDDGPTDDEAQSAAPSAAAPATGTPEADDDELWFSADDEEPPAPAPAREPIRIGSGDPSPPRPAEDLADPVEAGAADEGMRFDDDDYDEEGGGGRRAVTILLTVLGGLLLLAAGGIVGLLVIRIVLG